MNKTLYAIIATIFIIFSIYSYSYVEHSENEFNFCTDRNSNLFFFSEIWKNFQKKHPYLKFKVNNIPEGRDVYCDIIVTSHPFIAYFLEKNELLIEYEPKIENYLNPFENHSRYFTTGINFYATTYNPKLVTETPKSYEDILNPVWKGKIGMYTHDYFWFANILSVMGKEKGIKFVQDLIDQDLLLVKNRFFLEPLLTTGNLYFIVNHKIIYNIDEIYNQNLSFIEPIIVIPVYSMIPKSSSNKEAAKSYIDFLLSREGQKIRAYMGGISVRSDIHPNYLDFDDYEVYMCNETWILENYDMIVNEYNRFISPVKVI